MTATLVLVGAMVGAPLRYLTDRAVQARHAALFPWGTWVVNVLGSLVLGGLAGAGAALPPAVSALVGVGFCGALTTYSTFGYETLRLVEEKAHARAALNVLASVLGAVLAALLGHTAVHAVLG
ncbi:fluoride efflux transporter CrcB [Saccharopolyspora sp. MS10]|uniref:fluoride efflux transporter CrcB n=1 Tax=Saccharopolyspora sp. MS10 TaxID=3385973 RepID=UPI0039A2CFAF